MPFQILIRISDPYRRVSINRYSYYRVPTAASRKLAFRLGGVLIFQPLGAGTTRPGGGLGAGLAAVAAGGQGADFQDVASWASLGPLLAHLVASWASLGSSWGFLGLSWLILGASWRQRGAKRRPREPTRSPRGAKIAPRELPREARGAQKPEKKQVKCVFFVSQSLLP